MKQAENLLAGKRKEQSFGFGVPWVASWTRMRSFRRACCGAVSAARCPGAVNRAGRRRGYSKTNAGSNTNAELRTEEEESGRPGVAFLRFGVGSSALDVGCSPFGAGVSGRGPDRIRTSNIEHRTEEEERERPGVAFLRFDVGSSALDVGCSPFGAEVSGRGPDRIRTPNIEH